jgi:transposase InsO family protein
MDVVDVYFVGGFGVMGWVPASEYDQAQPAPLADTADEILRHLAVENIDHSRTKARQPQTNGICERFHRTIQEEFYATAFRKKLYHSLEDL